MRPFLLVALAAALVLAGCSAKGEDPFAYTRKPLYTGGFDLEDLRDKTDLQTWRVEDGSITAMKVQVWVNATAGHAEVRILDPSGRDAFVTTENGERTFPLHLGQWRVHVKGDAEAAGHVGILVTRS